MKIVFKCPLSEAEQELVLTSNIYQNWAQSLDSSIQLHHIEIQSVDFITRSVKRVLFIKMKTQAVNSMGQNLPGIVMLRGAAVSILPVLLKDEEPYVVLVRQARLGPGQSALLEVPAGILDVNLNFEELAVKELQEETGLIASPGDLVEMLSFINSEHKSLYTNAGISDETLKFYLYERPMLPRDLNDLSGRLRSSLDEDEYIKVELMPLSSAKKQICDSKSLLSILLYESRRRSISK